MLYGRDGLPVLSHDGEHLLGWITRNNVLTALVGAVDRVRRERSSAGRSPPSSPSMTRRAGTRPQHPADVAIELVELTIRPGAPAVGRRLDQVRWPAASLPVAITTGREILAARGDIELAAGERVIVLVPGAKPTFTHTSTRLPASRFLTVRPDRQIPAPDCSTVSRW